MGDRYRPTSLHGYGLELLGSHHGAHAAATGAETELADRRAVINQVLPTGANT